MTVFLWRLEDDFCSTQTVGPVSGGRGFTAAVACSCTSDHFQAWGQALRSVPEVQKELPASEALTQEPSIASLRESPGRGAMDYCMRVGVREGVTEKAQPQLNLDGCTGAHQLDTGGGRHSMCSVFQDAKPQTYKKTTHIAKPASIRHRSRRIKSGRHITGSHSPLPPPPGAGEGSHDLAGHKKSSAGFKMYILGE